MKTSKECTTCQNHFLQSTDYPCASCGPPEFNMYESASGSITITTHINSKLERDKPNKMKNTPPKRILKVLKQMFTLSSIEIRIASASMLIAFSYDALKSIGEKSSGEIFTFMDILFVFVILVGFWLLGYFSRKPDPNRKGFKKWVKICKLKVQIWHKQAYLFWYPDLKKYRGNPKRKEKVWAKRGKLKGLKRELSNILKS